MLSNFLIIEKKWRKNPVVREKIRLKIALDIPTGAPTTLVKEMIDTSPLAALKKFKTFSM